MTESILFAATSCGLAASSGSNSSSSRRSTSRSSAGGRPEKPDTSTTWISTRVRSRCFRKRWPSPRLVRAFDQPGDVRDHEAAVVAELNDAEIRRERRERVVGDLRPRRGDARDQRGLAGVRDSRPGRRRRAASGAGAGASARPAARAVTSAARGSWTSRSARCRGRPGRPARRARARPPPARSASGRHEPSSASCS